MLSIGGGEARWCGRGYVNDSAVISTPTDCTTCVRTYPDSNRNGLINIDAKFAASFSFTIIKDITIQYLDLVVLLHRETFRAFCVFFLLLQLVTNLSVSHKQKV